MELALDRTAVVDLASSLGGTELELRSACAGGDALFLLLSYRDERGRLGCAVAAVDRVTLEPWATHALPYIKHDNGGGTLRCTASGSRLSVGTEFTIHVLDTRDGSLSPTHDADTEQHTEEGCFWGEDHLLHLDEMSAGGLVLTDLRDETTSVLELESPHRYGVSPAGAFGAFITSDGITLELVTFSLPDLQVLGRQPLAGTRDELLFHPTEAAVFTVDGETLIRVDVGSGARSMRARPMGRLVAFDHAGRAAFARTDYYRLPSTPPTLEVWVTADDRVVELELPVSGRAWWGLGDDTLAVAHREPEPPEGVRLSFVRRRG